MSKEVIQAIDANIKEARKIVELAQCLERLRSNRDFKRVILEGYFEQESIRLVHLKADPNMQNENSQKSILNQIDAVGSFRQYLDMVARHARLAEKAIAADEETREEILNEDSDEVSYER